MSFVLYEGVFFQSLFPFFPSPPGFVFRLLFRLLVCKPRASLELEGFCKQTWRNWVFRGRPAPHLWPPSFRTLCFFSQRSMMDPPPLKDILYRAFPPAPPFRGVMSSGKRSHHQVSPPSQRPLFPPVWQQDGLGLPPPMNEPFSPYDPPSLAHSPTYHCVEVL